MNNYKTVFFSIGILLIILGAFMLIPFFVQIIYDEKNSTFLSSASITSFIGVLLVLTNLEENRKLNLQQAFLLTTLSWLSIAIFGCLPFLQSGLNISLVDSFFESMSGITTTGSTIITNLNDAPKGILLWRAILQWLGGIGVIVMAITILPLLNIGGMQLFRMESSDTAEKILPKTREVTLTISIIYLSLQNLKNIKISISKKIYHICLLQSTFILICFFTLVSAFIISDFSIINVYENSHSLKPFFYKFSGTWGNHEGSLLLWVIILTIFSFLFLLYNKHHPKNYRIYSLIIQILVVF